jgi:hypothetical protein
MSQWVNRVGFGVPLARPVIGNLGSADCPVLPVEGIGLNVIVQNGASNQAV